MSERDAIVAVTEADREAYSKMMVTWTDVSGPEHFARHRATHAGEVERLREEIADLKSSVIAFGAPWAVTYAREFDLPPNHIHATHYDILEKAGARMVSFIRHDPEALEASR